MIAADHDRRLQLAVTHHFVEGKAEAVTLAEAYPADARRQALERDPFARHVEPVMQVVVIGDEFLHLGIGLVDVLRIARQRAPAERTDALAEQRTDIGRHEAGEGEGILEALVQGDLADVVAVIEGRNAPVPEGDHGFHMFAHGGARRLFDRLRIALALGAPFAQRPALGQIAVDRIVGRGLVGDDVGMNAARGQFREDVGGIAEQADGLRLTRLGPGVDHGQRLVEGGGLLVDITGAQAEIDPGLVAFHGEAAGTGHDGGQRLGAAHAAETGGQDPLALEVAVIMLAAGFSEGLVGALDDALGADVDPGTGGHLAVHGQALLIQLVEMIPGRPVGHQVGIGDQDPRRILVGPEHADRLAGLDQQGFGLFQAFQRGNDAVEVVPCAGRAADAAVDDQLMRVFRHVRMQVVHKHAQRSLRQPGLGIQLRSGRREHVAGVVAAVSHGHSSGHLVVSFAPVFGRLPATRTSSSSISFRCTRSRSAFSMS